MVHKSDISWTAKVNNPSDLYKKGDDVEAIILSINHDEKKVSLGVKQLWDDPWPTIFNELPAGQGRERARSLSIVDYGVFVQRPRRRRGAHPAERDRAREGRDGRRGPARRWATTIEAEIANIDTQERASRCRCAGARPRRRRRRARRSRHRRARRRRRKKTTAAEAAAGGTIGELIKQKLGAKLAQISTEKKDDDDEDDASE